MSPGRKERGAEIFWTLSAIALLFASLWRATALVGDSYWYIATGRWILDHGMLPQSDPFSFTAIKSRWILHMLFCDLSFAFLERHGGAGQLLFWMAGILCATWFLLWRGFCKSARARLFLFYVVLLYILLLQYIFMHFGARGQLPADLAWVILMLCLWRLRQGHSVHLAIPALLSFFWINLHPSALLAVALPVFFSVFLLLEDGASASSRRALLVFSAISALCLGLSPYSFGLLKDVVGLLANRTMAFVNVQRPYDFHTIQVLVIAAIALLTIGLRSRLAASRFLLLDVATMLAFLLMALLARRHAVLVLGFSVILLAQVLEAQARVLERLIRPKRLYRLFLLMGLLQVGLAAILMAAPKEKFRAFYTPAGAVNYLNEHAWPGRIFNPYHWGGYLIYRWMGQPQVFIDGRNDLYANQVLNDYIFIRGLDPTWEALLKLYEIDTILWEADTPLDHALHRHAGWREAYRDTQSVVYFRRPKEAQF